MAHFVSLQKYVPSPEDDIDTLVVDNSGVGIAGLWGFRDGAIACAVKVVSGPGTAKAGEVRGGSVQIWKFAGLTSQSRIQAFSDTRPFTGVLNVRVSGPSTIAVQNKALLNGDDDHERAKVGGRLVDAVPLSKGIGNYAHAPRMGTIRGLAVHITAGGGESAKGLAHTFEAGNVSTHFVIDRGGAIAQYVAASIQAQAQGMGNAHYLSVEMAGRADSRGKCQPMSGGQVTTLRQLWQWVVTKHHVPPVLARPYIGTRKLSGELGRVYRTMAEELVSKGMCNAAGETIASCNDSSGLSCHYWLDLTVKACPGIGMMGQLPEILGRPRVRVTGDEAFLLPA